MKNISCFLLILFLFAACGNKGRSNENITALEETEEKVVVPVTNIRYLETTHDFGQVNEGEKVTHTFAFENTGASDLLLLNVRASCGCTTPKYDKKPISPGRKGSIEVAFNTKGRPGKQRKTVSVKTNTEPSTTVLSFTCEVLPKEDKNN